MPSKPSVASPYSIIVDMPDGTPAGLRNVRSTRGVAKGLIIPRSRYAAARGLPELRRTGVYFLVGPDIESGEERIYIGEGDPVLARLDSHAAARPFWTQAFVFTGDSTLNKAHIRYLESKLIDLATRAKQSTMDNRKRTESPSLVASELAYANGFLQDLLLCYELVGSRAFLAPEGAEESPQLLVCKGTHAAAQGRQDGGGLVVLVGSRARRVASPKAPNHLLVKRQRLTDDGVLREEGDSLVFTQDYRFDSTSTAAGVVLGTSASGPERWRDNSGRSLKDREGL